MLTLSSAPPAAWMASGPNGDQMSSQIEMPTFVPADLNYQNPLYTKARTLSKYSRLALAWAVVSAAVAPTLTPSS